MQVLPPLNSLRAFEAAARRLSITEAADELHVTPGAVSRQIRALEAALGRQLFVRGHRQISLTPAGEEYFKAVTKAVADLRDATSKLTKGTGPNKLKVRAYTTFAMRWLIPRLSSFHAENTGVEVLLTASLDPVDFDREDIDAAIRLGPGSWPDVRAYRLASNVLVPVCSPELARRVREPADLVNQVLLHSIARPDDWAIWLRKGAGLSTIDPSSGMTYQSSAMAYAAALESQGFAIAQKFLVEGDLASGKLVAPFSQAVDMGDFTYYLLTPMARGESKSMRLFREWLLSQFA
ncbi:transcriptional regulator GcvA [Parapusillimonas granuli]|uniref:Transcriptional regulator GcvA n=1 Tax=Parapusillimonas granuli TaxID=380911 RepID=A0A853G2D2_9BURK|nr:transcriptional regulator GcvA [Parapusillimonas granuli]MBB5214431.1 LysR family glycine cleavage system transcriptional activator [Parapusillimonas granuli]MEB2398317.1 transcriptional regulator GcvA [Alcaligenaceae bacterium]NYT49160.1 transcriptional regulator GcvA [Parapusillimonas granuli]